MRAKIAVVLMAATMFSVPAWSEKPEMTARALVENGIAAYKQADAAAAIKVWIKGSALEGNTQALTQANNLRAIEDYYGKPVGVDIVKEYEAGPRVRVLYVTINYVKGAAFAKFQVYRVDGGEWVTTQFLFNTDATQIFPSCLFAN